VIWGAPVPEWLDTPDLPRGHLKDADQGPFVTREGAGRIASATRGPPCLLNGEQYEVEGKEEIDA